MSKRTTAENLEKEFDRGEDIMGNASVTEGRKRQGRLAEATAPARNTGGRLGRAGNPLPSFPWRAVEWAPEPPLLRKSFCMALKSSR
jgi:hypothetical protein